MAYVTLEVGMSLKNMVRPNTSKFTADPLKNILEFSYPGATRTDTCSVVPVPVTEYSKGVGVGVGVRVGVGVGEG